MNSKKNILLTTSAAASQSPFSTTEKRPPLGIGFLISVLRNAGHEVFFIDNYLRPSNFLETDYLARNRIDLVGIYANTICYRDTLRMLHRLEYIRRSGSWGGKIIVGGPHTSVAPATIPDFVDYVVQGEGEQVILDIVEDKVKDRILCYPSIKNLDELPMPAWDYFVHLPYNWGVNWFRETPVFTMNTSRGCPFRCAFCSVGSIWGKKYTYFSAKRIVSDIEYLIEHYGAKGIYFREDNFTLNKNRLKEFCSLLIEKGIKIFWYCESRVDALDREMVKLMYRAGARAFYFGVESGSQKILDFMKKDITLEHTRNAFRLCHEFGIKTAASVIVGVPTETEEDIQKTSRLLKEIKPDISWYNAFVGIPNSELYRFVRKNKLYQFIDDRGLVYLKGHNERVKKFYGGQWKADIPVNMENPGITIVMSVYNGGRYLGEAVRSILMQTYQDFEFIIVDDASTDGTKEILRKFEDPRIKIIKNSENLGLTRSLNKGIALAKGEYIARMDADDISLPHRLEMQINFLEKNPEYGLIGSSYYQIDNSGRRKELVTVLPGDMELKKRLKKQNCFGHGSVMMKKEAFLKVEGYDERFTFSQDYDLWLRISEAYKVANIEEPLYYWRFTESCISREKSAEQRHYARLAVSEARKRANVRLSGKKVSPMVSIIVPTYCRPDMLREAVKSILNQTYQDFEIVVVNDNGTDVENVVSSLNKKATITYIKHGENRGLAAARNTGLKVARGKYIAYLDDDDLFYQNHLETLVKFLEENDYRIAYTDAHRLHQEKRNEKYLVINKDVPYSFDFDCERILRENFIPVLCFMHEKSCLDEIGLFDESLRRLEDWDLWVRMSQKLTFAHIKKVTCAFSWRTDGTTMTSGKWEEFKKAQRVIAEKYSSYRREKGLQLHPISCMSTAKKGLVSIIILTFNQMKYTKECMESIKRYTPEPHDIIFVDNGSTDGTVKWLKGLIKENTNYKLIENRKNLGFAQGCNQGIGASSGEYILLLNNDVVVTEGWLSGMLECLTSNPAVGIVGPMTNIISGPQKVVNATYSSMLQMHEYARTFRKINRHRRIPFRRVVGFCMLLKHELVEKIGLLDESFGSGNFEDDDFSLRAALEGYRNFIAGDVFIHHYGSKSFIGNGIDYSATMSGNRRVFADKWSGIPSDSILGKNLVIRNAIENAKELNQKGEIDKAVQRLIKGIGQAPDNEEIYQALAVILIEAKRFKDALDALNSMPDKAKEGIKTLALIGYCKEGMGLSEEAQRYADQTLSINPAHASTLNLKGSLAYKRGDGKTAEDFFKKAIKSDPGYGEPYTHLGILQWAEGKKQEGLKLLERGFILSPTVMDLANSYHSAISETKKFAEGECLFRDAKALHPINQRISYLLIDILLQQEKYNAAMQEIEEAMILFDLEDGILSAAIEVRGKVGAKEIQRARKGKGTLSLSMIVKNEEQYLAKCLKSVKPVVDEMVVVDTGSTDRTKDIARAFGAKVYDFTWTDDFAAARNCSLSYASGDWILVLDADEVISPIDHALVTELVNKDYSKSIAYDLITRNYTTRVNVQGWVANGDKYNQEQAGNGWYPSTKVRLFKNNDRIRFVNSVHECVEPSILSAGIKIKPCPIHVHHYGRLGSHEKIQAKREAYYRLGKKKLGEKGDDPKAIYELAIIAGELEKYEEAVALWQRFIQLDPSVPSAFINMGSAYRRLGEYQEALNASKKAVNLNPDLKDAVINYASCMIWLDDVKKVIPMLENSLQKVPDFIPAICLLAMAYCINENIEKGVIYLDMLRKKGFNTAKYLCEQAQILSSLGREEYVYALLKAAIQSKHDSEETHKLLEKCHTLLEKKLSY